MPIQCVVHLNNVKNGTPFFIVHPFEGVTIALKSLAGKLKCPVYGIQCTAQTPLNSIEAIASFYIQVCVRSSCSVSTFFAVAVDIVCIISQQIQVSQPEGPYRISGYSFGASVAFEMAIQLQERNPENPNIVENLILLEGSHNFVSAYIEGNNNNDDDDDEVFYICTS